ncbi:MAG: hypothetical protein ACREEG_06815, partial [Phenylobacterium sp.]
ETASGDLRCRDLDLAERLGYERPVDVRQLIRRHEAALARFGVICTAQITAGAKGGRPGREFQLNLEQTLFLIHKSDVPKAVELTIFAVRVFSKYVQGKLIAADPETAAELERAKQQLQERNRELSGLREEMLRLEEARRWKPPADGALFASEVDAKHFCGQYRPKRMGGWLTDYARAKGVLPAQHPLPSGLGRANVYPQDIVQMFVRDAKKAGYPDCGRSLGDRMGLPYRR